MSQMAIWHLALHPLILRWDSASGLAHGCLKTPLQMTAGLCIEFGSCGGPSQTQLTSPRSRETAAEAGCVNASTPGSNAQVTSGDSAPTVLGYSASAIPN